MIYDNLLTDTHSSKIYAAAKQIRFDAVQTTAAR